MWYFRFATTAPQTERRNLLFAAFFHRRASAYSPSLRLLALLFAAGWCQSGSCKKKRLFGLIILSLTLLQNDGRTTLYCNIARVFLIAWSLALVYALIYFLFASDEILNQLLHQPLNQQHYHLHYQQ